jgi:hypothetical protein
MIIRNVNAYVHQKPVSSVSMVCSGTRRNAVVFVLEVKFVKMDLHGIKAVVNVSVIFKENVG